MLLDVFIFNVHAILHNMTFSSGKYFREGFYISKYNFTYLHLISHHLFWLLFLALAIYKIHNITI